MAIQKKLLNRLKRDLRGHMTAAAGEIGTTPASVSRVLDGKQKNDEMILSLIEYRNKLQERNEKSLQNLRKQLSK